MRGGKNRREGGPKRARRPVLEALSLPEDAAGGAVRLIALGDERLLVENHLGIAEVTATRVRLLAPEGMQAADRAALEEALVRQALESARARLPEGAVERACWTETSEAGGCLAVKAYVEAAMDIAVMK